MRGDLGDAARLARAMAGVDAVMHFAGLLSVADSMADPASYYRTNVVKGLALLEAMSATSVRDIVFSSTCAVYGMPVRVPMDEDHPREPINPYGATKLAFERALADHGRAGSLRAVALRYFNAAGCHPDGSLGEDHRPEVHIVPRAVDAALGLAEGLTIHGEDYDTPDGTCIRDYIHVTDLARAHLLALDACSPGEHRIYNLGNGSGYSNLEVLQTCREVTGHEIPSRIAPRRPGDPPVLIASSERFHAERDWRPEADLAAMITDAWQFAQGQLR